MSRPTHRPPKLTPRRIELLRLLRDHAERHGRGPSKRELAAALGVRGDIVGHLDALDRLGLLSWPPGELYGLRVTEQGLALLDGAP